MKKIIKTLLSEWNFREIPKIIPRDIDLNSYLNLKVNKIVVLNGFRRVGKTFILYYLSKMLFKKYSRQEVIHINFEDERIPLQTSILTELLPTLKEFSSSEVKYLLLDEIHNIPEWSKWLRRIHDTENIKIFVSGSSSKMSEEEIPTELRGRFLELKVFPLSFNEFLRFKGRSFELKNLSYSANLKAELLRYLNEYLIYGGLPEIVLFDVNKKFELAQSYYNTVIKRDIIDRFKVKNEEVLKALIKLLLNSTEYSINKTYNTLKSLGYTIGKGTIQKYVRYIENSYFLVSTPIFSYKIKDQMQHPRKIYFIDTAFINAISTRFSQNLGRLYENIVAVELKRRRKETYYWKNAEKEEVDFLVMERDRITSLIQVCYDISDRETKQRETRALLKAGAELKCKNLMIITEDHEGMEKAEWFGKKGTIKYIPLWKWLLV